MTNTATHSTLASPNAATLTGRTEIAFVLDNVADWQTLAAGMPAGVEVVVLDSRGDGLAQMADWLAKKAPGSVDAIHLLGHGSAGALYLGSTLLDGNNLAQYTSQLGQIGQGCFTAVKSAQAKRE